MLPKRSTGGLLADGFQQAGIAQPLVLEAYNVIEKGTLAALVAGGDGQGTRIGHLFEDTVKVLGGTITRWEPIQDGNAWHLRVHISFP